MKLVKQAKVAEEFWDFLGGKGSYIKLRPEIDEYFARFNK